jgi:schlafen family protein
MKRFLYLFLFLKKQQAKLFYLAALLGAGGGVLLLYPLYDFIYFHEHAEELSQRTPILYVLHQFKASLSGQTPEKTIFLAGIGAILGVLVLWGYTMLHSKLQHIHRLGHELDRDLLTMIDLGEGPTQEFKSSFRWDLEQNRINKNLEWVVLKTIAGYLNSGTGGTLLIGVSDDGEIIGLESDYKSLKRPNQDGFEQLLIGAIANNLGADLCEYVRFLFHKVEEKDVCRLIILPAPHPVFLQQGNIPKFFLRTGGGTRDLNIKEAVEHIAQRW